MSEENVEVIRRASAEFTEPQQVPSELVAPEAIWDLSSWAVGKLS